MGFLGFLKKKEERKANEQEIKDNATEKPVATAVPPQEKITHKVEVNTESPGPITDYEKILSDKIDRCIKSNSGLCPHEILVLNYIESFSTDQKEFQGFWKYDYSVSDVNRVINKLCKEGFAKIGGLEETLKNMKNTELKELLSKYGMSKTGSKEELIERILKSDNVKAIETNNQKWYYKLTDTGCREIDTAEYIKYIHQHRNTGLDIWSFNLITGDKPKRYRDTLWGYFNRATLDHYSKGDFGLYANTRRNMYSFLREEGRYKDAFVFLCEVVCYDLSGLSNGGYFNISKENIDFYFPYEDGNLLCSQLAKLILDSANEAGMNEDEAKELFLKEAERRNFFQTLFSRDECWQIMVAESKEDIQTLKEIYAVAEKRVRDKKFGPMPPNVKIIDTDQLFME